MSQSEAKRVAAVVLNCNGEAVIEDCLRSLQASDHPSLDIIVVDNASTDRSLQIVGERFPKVSVVRNTRNLGWSGANNAGIRKALAAGVDFVWLLNNDIEVEPSCVSELVAAAARNPGAAILGPMIYYFDDRSKAWFSGGCVDAARYYSDHTATIEEFRALPPSKRYISGCALLVRSEVFRRIGLIDERFFIYFEDVDFCCRASAAGFEMEVVESAGMYHKVGAFSSHEGLLSPWKAYHILRSGLLFWRKHLGFAGFHRGYCPSQLGKWVNGLAEAWADEKRREWARSVMDALWYFLSGKRCPLDHPRSPDWFVRLMTTRPWLVAEWMSLRLPWPVRVS